jgi:hypothetical protein
MMCAWVSQERRGNPRFGARGLKSGPAHSGASVFGESVGVFLDGAFFFIVNTPCLPNVPKPFWMTATPCKLLFNLAVCRGDKPDQLPGDSDKLWRGGDMQHRQSTL